MLKDFAVAFNSTNFVEYLAIFKMLGYPISSFHDDLKLPAFHNQIIFRNERITTCGDSFLETIISGPQRTKFGCIEDFLEEYFKNSDKEKLGEWWTVEFKNQEEKDLFTKILRASHIFSKITNEKGENFLYLTKCCHRTFHNVCSETFCKEETKNKGKIYSIKEFWDTLLQDTKKAVLNLPTNWSVKFTNDDDFVGFKQKLEELGYKLYELYKKGTSMSAYNTIICDNFVCSRSFYEKILPPTDFNNFSSVEDFWAWMTPKIVKKEEIPPKTKVGKRLFDGGLNSSFTRLPQSDMKDVLLDNERWVLLANQSNYEQQLQSLIDVGLPIYDEIIHNFDPICPNLTPVYGKIYQSTMTSSNMSDLFFSESIDEIYKWILEQQTKEIKTIPIIQKKKRFLDDPLKYICLFLTNLPTKIFKY